MKLNGKSRSDTVRKPMSIKRLAGAVLVLVAAAGIGMAIREYRFWSWEKQLAQTQKAARPAETPKAPKEPEVQNIQEQQPVEEVVIEPETPAPEPVSPPTSPDADGQSSDAAQMEAAAPPERDSRLEDPAVKEQRGRTALAMIGHNPEADEVWIGIINDPSVSANARSNLIEDLNEDGLSYRNLTMDDLPVIKYRIELIEELKPYAMDKVNADAFDEARKDLVNMANRLTGR